MPDNFVHHALAHGHEDEAGDRRPAADRARLPGHRRHHRDRESAGRLLLTPWASSRTDISSFPDRGIGHDPGALSTLLAREGFIAAEEESRELLDYAGGDLELLDAAVRRRLTGEPLAWIVGKVTFCGVGVRVDPNVYVPRWLSEPLARRAVERLPYDGVAIDLCTGSGAIATVLSAHRPGARVAASEIDERAVACARANGVDVYQGDLFAPLPAELVGRTDLVVGVVPYVPTPELPLLQRDTFTFETPMSYDGGPDGTDILRRVLHEARPFLRRGGVVLLELGGDQAELLADDLARLGYAVRDILTDDDGDVRAIEASLDRPPGPSIGCHPDR